MSLRKIGFLLILLSHISACGGGSNSDKSTFSSSSSSSSSANLPPIAIITDPGAVVTANGVILDGSSSNDPENSLVAYTWTLISSPLNSQVKLLSTNESTITFTPDFDGDYVIQLTVADNVGLMDSMELRISAKSNENVAPQIKVFNTNTLDVDVGTSVDFNWQFIDINNDIISCNFDPYGNGIIINDCLNTQGITFTYEIPGTYRPTLTVSDDKNTTIKNTRLIARGTPFISLISPTPTQMVGQTLPISVNISSTYEIISVTAQIGVKKTDLSYNAIKKEFGSILDLTGLTKGEYTLEIIARDITDKESRHYQLINYDIAPTLVISQPVDYSVATPLLPLSVTCEDDGGVCEIEIYNIDTYETLASGVGSIDRAIDLSAYTGKSVSLGFRAKDSSGQRFSKSVTVYVENSTKLTSAVTVNGQILDVENGKILYKTSDYFRNNFYYHRTDSIHIFNRSQNATFSMALPAEKYANQVQKAYLSNHGVILQTKDMVDFPSFHTYYWNNEFYEWEKFFLASVNGDYLTWRRGSDLIRRNLNDLTDVIISTSDTGGESLAVDGAVVWEQNDQIYFYDGTVTQITSNASLQYRYPITDGKKIVYAKRGSCCSSEQYSIVLFSGGSEIFLGAVDLIDMPEQDYQIRDGWIAYTNIGNSGQKHVWSYDALGNKVQRTFFQASSYIDALGDDGEMMVISGNKRYFSPSVGSLIEIGSSQGRSHHIDNRWYVAIGRELFLVTD